MQSLGGREAAAVSVNASGQSVGWASVTDGLVKAVTWDRDGMLETLDEVWSQAYAINRSGDVVGSRIVGGIPVARFWAHSGVGGQDLTPLYSEAYDINDAGWSVGFVNEPPEATAFVHDGTSLHELRNLVEGPNPFDNFTEARAIGNRGEIVGVGRRGDQTSVPFLLTPTSRVH